MRKDLTKKEDISTRKDRIEILPYDLNNENYEKKKSNKKSEKCHRKK